MTMIKKICAAVTAAMLISSAAMAADNNEEPSEVNADAIEYDMNTGIVEAEGNVLLKHGATKATGLHAMFNVNTKEAHLIGNVIVMREDMRITCNKLASDGQGYMVADGNVIATQTVAPDAKYPNGDTRTFTSEHIDYFPEEGKHIIIPTGGIAKSEVEGTFTADQIEGWIDEEHYIGRGNAHLVSFSRNMEAGGDEVDYSGKDAGKAVLSGNAWAYQDNNTIRGNRLTVYLADDGNLKADATPKFEMPPMPTVDKVFDKGKEATAHIQLVEENQSIKEIQPVEENQSIKEIQPVEENQSIKEIQSVEEIQFVEENSAEEKILIDPEENSSAGRD